ncbi:hypothetical protein BJ912DRAFT_1108831 [Pholiota molesta]|nr:hypothetical protein BJ912DRAFT_1108831 [Pholiota molesta]
MATSTFSIAELKLDTTVRGLALARLSSVSDDDSAAVAAAGVASFIQNLSRQKQQDVLDSTLLAQLSASGQYDRFEQTEQWYNYYTWVLQNIGWVVKEFKFDSRVLPADPTTVDKVVLDYMATYVDPAQLALLQRTMDAMQERKGNQKPISIFLSSSVDRQDKAASFQFGSCVEDAKSNVSFSIGAFTYLGAYLATEILSSTKSTISHTLFTKLVQGSASFMSAFQVMSLSDKDYAPHREAVIEKLASHAETLVSNIILPA